MAAPKIKLDSAGLADVLSRPEVASKIEALGASIASAVGSPTAGGEAIPVKTRTRVASGGRLKGSRPAVDISLAHPAGLRVEAMRGPLAKAAASVGLEVKKMGR